MVISAIVTILHPFAARSSPYFVIALRLALGLVGVSILFFAEYLAGKIYYNSGW